MYRARLRSIFEGADPRVLTAFWLFGLINNVLYVIILTAALDLVGPTVPKGIVLLCNVIPAFIVKLLCPYYAHLVPYYMRILVLASISIIGMLLVAASPAYDENYPAKNAVVAKMIGVAFASASSGGGEVTFLSLTHFYGPFSLAGWGSGTGAAGLVGAGAYALATTSVGLGSRVTLFASAFLPFALMGSFFLLLPMEPLRRRQEKNSQVRDQSIEDSAAHAREDDDDDAGNDDNDNSLTGNEQEGLLSPPPQSHRKPSPTTLSRNLHQIPSLLLPYMLPLLLVYFAEYLTNLSLHPTLLFPLPSTPFTHYRAFYPAYSTIYQLGVFLSRSSLPLIRIHALYPPAFLQCLNFFILLSQALWPWMGEGGVWWVFVIVLWEGLLGGGVYVNTFAEIGERVGREEREFALGAVSVADSAGIVLAGAVAVVVEGGVCRWQVERLGRDWCRRL